MSLIKIKIDGHPIEVEEGSFVLEAARTLGIYIPTLCYYPYMTPYAACRICVVEARDGKGWTKIVTACNYPVWEGLQDLHRHPASSERPPRQSRNAFEPLRAGAGPAATGRTIRNR